MRIEDYSYTVKLLKSTLHVEMLGHCGFPRNRCSGIRGVSKWKTKTIPLHKFTVENLQKLRPSAYALYKHGVHVRSVPKKVYPVRGLAPGTIWKIWLGQNYKYK